MQSAGNRIGLIYLLKANISAYKISLPQGQSYINRNYYNGRYTVDSLLTDTSIKQTPRVGPSLPFPLFDSLYFDKTDTSCQKRRLGRKQWPQIHQPFAVLPALHSVLFFNFYSSDVQLQHLYIRDPTRRNQSVSSVEWSGPLHSKATSNRLMGICCWMGSHFYD